MPPAVASAASRSSAASGLATDALAIYRELGDPYGAATALAELGWYDMVTASAEHAEEYLDEALDLRRRFGDDRRLVEPLIDGAWLALVQGDTGDAQTRFLDCLAMARQVDDRFIVGEALAGLSAVAGTECRWSDCAHLDGASAAVHARIGAPPWESVVMLHERAAVPARTAIGPAYGECAERGRSLPLDDILERTVLAPVFDVPPWR